MPHVKTATLAGIDASGAHFDCNDGIGCRVHVISPHIFRVLFTRPSGLRQPRTWSVVPLETPAAELTPSPPHADVSVTSPADVSPTHDDRQRTREPHVGDTPLEGWDRLSIPFATCPFQAEETSPGSTVRIWTDALALRVSLNPFRLEWYARGDTPGKGGVPPGGAPPSTPQGAGQGCEKEEHLIASDRPSGGYFFSGGTHAFSHAMTRREGDHFMGLGDKTGALNLHGRRVKVAMRDALGYNPESGDPLYKHWPYVLVRDAASQLCYGVLYDNLAEGEMDLGCEHSNYYGLYRTYEAKDGDLDMYFVLGCDVRGVVARMVPLIGGTALMPRWGLGFHCTAMPLADAPDAQAQMEGFIQQSKASRVPCSAFHFGSGYTSIGSRRYVFHWNRDKFPDPQKLIASFVQAGMRVVANVKPCLLVDHPSYAELAAAGGFVAASAESALPAVSQFWDGEGSHVDFTNPLALDWWRKNMQSSLLDLGVSSAWNDNNEYEITEECARSHAFGSSLPLSVTRPLHCLLMTRSSYEQQLQACPSERPYSVTRAGVFGAQRYAQTWTGDNSTGWLSLQWNLRLGLTLGLSGLFNVGHDVGGFSGPVPEPELLVRWVQAGLLHPRFIMNSWKACGTVTTPWMHPTVLPHTRWAIRLRYRLVPYLYTLMWQASWHHVPVLRPTFFEFPGDERCWEECDEMLLGSFLLAAPVVEKGARQRKLYLPTGAAGVQGSAGAEGIVGAKGATGAVGWFDFFSEEFYEAGRDVTVAAPLSVIPLFVPTGAIIPLTAEEKDYSQLHDESSRVVRVFPPPGGNSKNSFKFVEDDGLTRGGQLTMVKVVLKSTEDDVSVTVTVTGDFPLPYKVLGVCLPAADARPLRLTLASSAFPLKLEGQSFRWHSLADYHACL